MLPLVSMTLTSALLTGAAKIEPTTVDEVVDVSVVGVSEVGDVVEVVSLELLQAASVTTEQAAMVLNMKVFVFKVFHRPELYKIKSLPNGLAKTMPNNNYMQLHYFRTFDFVNKPDRLCDFTHSADCDITCADRELAKQLRNVQ